MKIPKGWTRWPSVTRNGKFFYSNSVLAIAVTQNWVTGIWEARKGQSNQVIASATTAKECMAMVQPANGWPTEAQLMAENNALEAAR
jgi:hypothetical protein